MTPDDFSDLVSSEIRNTPIVRELDKGRQRELRGLLLLAVPLVAVLLFSGWQHFVLLQHGYRIEEMRREYAAEQELNRHLKLEIEALESPARIEQVAIDILHMVAPTSDDERVLRLAADAPRRDLSMAALGEEAANAPDRGTN